MGNLYDGLLEERTVESHFSAILNEKYEEEERVCLLIIKIQPSEDPNLTVKPNSSL